jgi:transposase
MNRGEGFPRAPRSDSVFRRQIPGQQMGKPLSMDLRSRTLAAVDRGLSRRAAARHYGVSVSSVIRWDAARRATGSFEPKPQGGDMRSRRIEARHAEVITAFEEESDQTLEELCGRLAERGIATSTSSLSRFFHRHGVTRKKRPGTQSSRTARTS